MRACVGGGGCVVGVWMVVGVGVQTTAMANNNYCRPSPNVCT